MTRHIKTFLIFLFAFVLFAGSVEALIKSPPQRAILPNGLRVIVAEDRSLPIVVALLMFNVNKGCGLPIEPGFLPVSMVLREKSDSTRPSRFDLNTNLETNGIQVFYSGAHPAFMGCQGPSGNLDIMMHFLSSVGFNLKPTQEDFDKAKDSVLRALKERQSFPLTSGYLLDGVSSLLFKGTPLGVSLYGAPENLSEVTLEKLNHLHGELFVPNNAVLVLVGDVGTSPVFKKAMDEFGQLTAKNLPSPASGLTTASSDESKEHREFLDVKTTQAMIAFEAPSLKDPDMPAAQLWATFLGEKNDSWLSGNFEKKFPEIRKLRANYDKYADSGIISIGFESEEPEIDRVLTSLLEGLSNLSLSPPRDEKLDQLIVSKKSSNTFDNEQRFYQAVSLAYAEIVKDFSLSSAFNAALERVTSDDMQRVAKKIFCSGRYSIKIVHPLASQNVVEPKHREESLENGLKLIVKPYAGSEVAGVNLLFSIGATCEGLGQEGFSGALAYYLHEACQIGKDDQGSLGKQLDKLGAGIEIYGKLESISVTAYVDKERLPELLKVIKAAIFQPTWNREILKKVVSNVNSQMVSFREAPDKILFNAFLESAYAGTPIARGIIFPESVKNITLTDLKAFHERWMIPEMARCTIVGNLDPKKALDDTRKILGEIPKARDACMPREPGRAEAAKVKMSEIEKIPEKFSEPFSEIKELEVTVPCGKDSAYLLVGFRFPILLKLLATEESRSDFITTTVISHLLTWSDNGIIQREMIQKGLAFEIMFSRLSITPETCFLSFLIHVPSAKSTEAKAALKTIIERIPSAPISQVDIESAGKFLNSYFMMGMERSSNLAKTISIFTNLGMGIDFAQEFSKMYSSVTPEKIQTAAKKYFKNYILITGRRN